ncbi:hypothetical protein MNBD_DELTA01-819 [hydrothermal vent metagenome]|uniref:Uncharacterized protein n=1 Tax=hydrothermal vent metagenome TaxID=652676 RepID=A0A3B0R2X8_9ZZZZ
MKSDGRLPRSVEIITQRPIMGSFLSSGIGFARRAGLAGKEPLDPCVQGKFKAGQVFGCQWYEGIHRAPSGFGSKGVAGTYY